jgi:hypothetical protein
MNEGEMLEVCEATKESRLALADRMAPLRDGKPAQWLADGVESGRYKISEVRVDGKPVAVFWWWFSGGNRALVGNAGASLQSGGDVCGHLLAGMEKLAKELGAHSVQFQTARRGLVEKAGALGYVPEGIVMTKLL